MVKRANGDGSVFEVRRGGQVVSWRATLTVGFDEQGKQVRVTGEGLVPCALFKSDERLVARDAPLPTPPAMMTTPSSPTTRDYRSRDEDPSPANPQSR